MRLRNDDTALQKGLTAAVREAQKQFLRLRALDSEILFFGSDGPHVGDPQRRVDVAALDAAEDGLRTQLPTVRVIGEEAFRSVRAQEYPIAVIDPVDGTLPYSITGHGFAAAGYILRRYELKQELWIPAAGIAISNGTYVGVSEEKKVWVTCGNDVKTFGDCVPRRPEARLSLACVGAKPNHAGRLAELRGVFPEAVIFNIGGNPLVGGVLMGDLDAIVSTEPQTPWDSVYLLTVSCAGGVVGAVRERRIYKPTEIVGWLRVVPQGSGMEIKTVPPAIAAKDEETYLQVCEALQTGIERVS